MKKILKLGSNLVLLSGVISGCGGERSSFESKPLVILSPEQRLRSSLEETWSFCRQENGISTKIVIDIIGHRIKLDAHVFADETCSGKRYESFSVGEFGHFNFKTADKRSGSAGIRLKFYYPNEKPFENEFITFDGRLMAEASAAFNLSADSANLTIILTNVRTISISDLQQIQSKTLRRSDAPKKDLAKSVVLNLRRDQELTPMVGAIKTGGLNGFDNQDQAVQWLSDNASTAVDKQCVTDYFERPLSTHFPKFDWLTNAFFGNRRSHTELTDAGYSTKEFQTLYLKDDSKTQYLGVLLYYYKLTHKSPEALSGFVCQLKDRPSKLSYSFE